MKTMNIWPAVALSMSALYAIAQTAIDFGDDSSFWANDGECDDPRFAGPGASSYMDENDLYRDATDCQILYDQGLVEFVNSQPLQVNVQASRIERGRLESGDLSSVSGKYLDAYTFQGNAGNEVVVELISQDFDTYLMLIGPSGEQLANDDHNGSQDHSLINLELNESGIFEVVVTSFLEGETGDYTLHIDIENTDESTDAAVLTSERGTLQPQDVQLPSGEYVDLFDFDWQAGDRVELDLQSNDFDTYLILAGPNNFYVDNDDDGGTNRSYIITDLMYSGSYTVGVTSYDPRETGDYDLTVGVSSPLATQDEIDGRDTNSIEIGTVTAGRLEDSDNLASLLDYDRNYYDSFAIDLSASQEIAVNLESFDFDPVVVLQTPSGIRYENDDYDGSLEHSFLAHTASESGRYRIFVTSYGEFEIGAYELTVGTSDVMEGDVGGDVVVDADGMKQLHGVFVGISDYPGDWSDLRFTAQDARIAHNAMVSSVGMDPSNSIVLTDSDATRTNVEMAIAEVASNSDADDLFVFFFSGHGNRVERTATNQEDIVGSLMDPDGQDETLVFYDEEIVDDELRELLNTVPGNSLIVLDSCFSGGFLKDLSHTNRIGFFSSQEDVVSAVADKFQAGGFMARFFSDGLNAFQADQDPRNGAISAHELRHYIQDRYRYEVVQEKNSDPGNWVSVAGNLGYQQAVVDLGGLRSPHTVLFGNAL